MTNYLNLDTNEYPRHDGDVKLNPKANWIEVVETIPSSPSSPDKLVVEDFPKLVNGTWIQSWKEIPMPEYELPLDTFIPSSIKSKE